MPCRAFFLGLAFVACSALTYHLAQPVVAAETAPDTDAEYYELYKVLADTMHQVEQNYVKEVDRRELMEAAIRGVLDKLDPYSNYISPEDLSRFKTSVESEFGGIGIQITMDRGQLKVLSPIVNSPAYRGGVRAGDSIVEIEGKTTDKITIDEAVRRLKGLPGTAVTLTLVHPGSSRRETLKLDREMIQIETVMSDRRKSDDDTWDFMLDPSKKIGYIRVTAFSRDTAAQLEDALRSLKKEGLRGLVIDLRFNPGGLLRSATEIADLFVSDGLIVTTRGRNTKPREVKARKPGTYEGFPIAVLVNRYSASASEIVSACLQDHHRAVVIGERTWGKGSVQNVIDLEEGKSALKLTTASYWRPSGKNIHRFPDAKETDEWGVMPDKGFELKLSDTELAALARHRRERDLLLGEHAGARKHDEELKSKPSEDKEPKEDAKDSESKEEPKKPETKKPDAKSDGEKPADETKEPATEEATSDESDEEFTDRQLQKALDYLTSEMAKAE